MGPRWLFSIGRVAGWMMLAFVVGVGVHSFVPSWHAPRGAWLLLLPTLAVSTVALRVTRWFTPGLVLFALVLGFWRFDIAPTPHLRSFAGRTFLSSGGQTSGSATLLDRWRGATTARIASALPPDAAHLVSGILYGDAAFSKEERERFVSSGLMHIVAVSGSNVTLVVQFMSLIAVGAGWPRRRTFWVMTAALVMFVGFVGFAASVSRAALMGWFMLLAREVGRPASSSRLLLVSAVGLLFIQPWQLLFDIGFALSFFAMWGILAWAPFFETRCAFLPERFGIRQAFAMTLAATLMTAPYLAWCFGRVTLVGLVTNLVVLPLIPFVMGSGMLVALWGTAPGSAIVSAPALGLSRIIQTIADVARLVPWATLTFREMKLSTLIATYALILYLHRQLSAKRELSTEKKKK